MNEDPEEQAEEAAAEEAQADLKGTRENTEKIKDLLLRITNAEYHSDKGGMEKEGHSDAPKKVTVEKSHEEKDNDKKVQDSIEKNAKDTADIKEGVRKLNEAAKDLPSQIQNAVANGIKEGLKKGGGKKESVPSANKKPSREELEHTAQWFKDNNMPVPPEVQDALNEAQSKKPAKPAKPKKPAKNKAKANTPPKTEKPQEEPKNKQTEPVHTTMDDEEFRTSVREKLGGDHLTSSSKPLGGKKDKGSRTYKGKYKGKQKGKYKGDARSHTQPYYKPQLHKAAKQQAREDYLRSFEMAGEVDDASAPEAAKEAKAERDANEANYKRTRRNQKRKAEEERLKRLAEHPIDSGEYDKRSAENRKLSRVKKQLEEAARRKNLQNLKDSIPARDVLKENARKEADAEWGLDEYTPKQREQLEKLTNALNERNSELEKWKEARKKKGEELRKQYEKEHPSSPLTGITGDDRIVSPEEFKRRADAAIKGEIPVLNDEGKVVDVKYEPPTEKPTVRDIEALHYKTGIPEEELKLKSDKWWNQPYTGTPAQKNIGVNTRKQMDELAMYSYTHANKEYAAKRDKSVEDQLKEWEAKHKRPEDDILRIALEIGIDSSLLHLAGLREETKGAKKVETKVTQKTEGTQTKRQANVPPMPPKAEAPTEEEQPKAEQAANTYMNEGAEPPKEEEEGKGGAKEKKKGERKSQRISDNPNYQKAWAANAENAAYAQEGFAARKKAQGDRAFSDAENMEYETKRRNLSRQYEAKKDRLLGRHHGFSRGYADSFIRSAMYRGERFLEWRSGLLGGIGGDILASGINGDILRHLLGYKTKKVKTQKPVLDEEGNAVLDEEGNKVMEDAEENVLISDQKLTPFQKLARKMTGFKPKVDENGNLLPMTEKEANLALLANKDKFMDFLGGVGRFAIPLIVATAVAGGTTAWIRDMRNRTLNNGTTWGGAFANTTQDALFDVAHLFGFSANSGKDIREDRQEALSQNYQLFSAKANDLVSTDMWARSMGLTTQADTNWIEEQVAMGKSAEQVRQSFLNLKKVSQETGVSFKNLSESIATQETNATKLLGKKYTVNLGKNIGKAEEALNAVGLNGTQQTLDDLAKNKQFQLALTRALNAKGYARQASELAATPGLLMEFAEDKGVFDQGLENFSRQYYNAASGQQLAYDALLVKSGLSAADVKTSLGGMYKFTQSGETMKQAEKQELLITVGSDLTGKVVSSGNYQAGLHDTTGTGKYFAMHNWTEDR